ncbi:hypothetical protein ACI8B_50298 [Acinetobacter proteolyticus]|uniref:Uncharacterized protein n=1 Tax=Acinetobacter proteolyticus TaxID=1776741 RepID=A0A653KA01_9GAMM|nr:hypothetical protein ACI8B_50298 [Acinetobacter proteolyticus]
MYPSIGLKGSIDLLNQIKYNKCIMKMSDIKKWKIKQLHIKVYGCLP